MAGVPLNRALSKLGVLSRTEAAEAIRAGRVRVDGRVVRDPLTMVAPERARIALDGGRRRQAAWRTIVFHLVTVRGRVTAGDAARIVGGIGRGRERIAAASAIVRKASERESHLTIELDEGRNREVRRLMAAIGREVTRLKRVALGRLALGSLQPGDWRAVSREELAAAFGPDAPIRR